MSPCGAGQGFEHLKTLLGLGFNRGHMLAKGEGRVEGDSKNLGGTLDWQEDLPQVYDGVMGVNLVRVRGEESDGGLTGRDRQLGLVSPGADVAEGGGEAGLQLSRRRGRLQDREVVGEGGGYVSSLGATADIKVEEDR